MPSESCAAISLMIEAIFRTLLTRLMGSVGIFVFADGFTMLMTTSILPPVHIDKI
jgi:hypothetical protein